MISVQNVVKTANGVFLQAGFPIRSGFEVLGVIEFFSRRAEQSDEDLLRMFAAVGSQIGQFIERQRAEQELALKARELESAKHPYTQGLLASLPSIENPPTRLPILKRDPAWLNDNVLELPR